MPLSSSTVVRRAFQPSVLALPQAKLKQLDVPAFLGMCNYTYIYYSACQHGELIASTICSNGFRVLPSPSHEELESEPVDSDTRSMTEPSTSSFTDEMASSPVLRKKASVPVITETRTSILRRQLHRAKSCSSLRGAADASSTARRPGRYTVTDARKPPLRFGTSPLETSPQQKVGRCSLPSCHESHPTGSKCPSVYHTPQASPHGEESSEKSYTLALEEQTGSSKLRLSPRKNVEGPKVVGSGPKGIASLKTLSTNLVIQAPAAQATSVRASGSPISQTSVPSNESRIPRRSTITRDRNDSLASATSFTKSISTECLSRKASVVSSTETEIHVDLPRRPGTIPFPPFELEATATEYETDEDRKDKEMIDDYVERDLESPSLARNGSQYGLLREPSHVRSRAGSIAKEAAISTLRSRVSSLSPSTQTEAQNVINSAERTAEMDSNQQNSAAASGRPALRVFTSSSSDVAIMDRRESMTKRRDSINEIRKATIRRTSNAYATLASIPSGIQVNESRHSSNQTAIVAPSVSLASTLRAEAPDFVPAPCSPSRPAIPAEWGMSRNIWQPPLNSAVASQRYEMFPQSEHASAQAQAQFQTQPHDQTGEDRKKQKGGKNKGKKKNVPQPRVDSEDDVTPKAANSTFKTIGEKENHTPVTSPRTYNQSYGGYRKRPYNEPRPIFGELQGFPTNTPSFIYCTPNPMSPISPPNPLAPISPFNIGLRGGCGESSRQSSSELSVCNFVRITRAAEHIHGRCHKCMPDSL